MEARLYTEANSGQTAKSNPKNLKIDETELSRLRAKDYWLQVSRAKLTMDLIFVCKFYESPGVSTHSWLTACSTAYDVFKIKRGAEPVKAFTGLMAAILRCVKVPFADQAS